MTLIRNSEGNGGAPRGQGAARCGSALPADASGPVGPSGAVRLGPVLDILLEHLTARLTDLGTTERVGPFLVAVDPSSARPFCNYAVPTPGARPTAAEVGSLLDRFSAHGRDARVEFFPALAPEVEDPLLAAGFEVERRSPVLALDAVALRRAEPPAGVSVRPVDGADDTDVAGAVLAAHLSFDEPGAPEESDLSRLRRSLRRGGGASLARAEPSGDPLGAAQHTPVVAGATEVVGVGVLPAHRRRGIATALSASVSVQALDAGARLVWLLPEGPGAELLYRAVGYRVVGEALHLGRAA
jgi:GNAT superfamily N-acetyltransferase